MIDSTVMITLIATIAAEVANIQKKLVFNDTNRYLLSNNE